MPKKTDIKTCRYRECNHKSKDINIFADKYVKIGSAYYHEDCYVAKKKKDEDLRKKKNATRIQTQKEKDDLLHIIDLWVTHINKQVNFGQLRKILNNHISNGISSEQLVFTLEYVISHNMKLNYPAGLKYYVNDERIQNAYYASLRKPKNNHKNHNEVVKLNEDNAPKFTFNPPSIGFSSILKRK